MRHFIGILFARLHASPLLLPVYNLLKLSGIHRLGHAVFDFFEMLRPTAVMKEDRMELRKHKKELREVYELLEDEKSRTVYQNAARFRVTKNRRCLRGIIEGKQYFADGIIKPDSREVFVDCGAFDGDTLRNFLKFSRSRYGRIIIFEPSAQNLDRIKKYAARKKLEDICFFQAGAGEKNRTAFFSGSGTADASVSESGSVRIRMLALDKVKECRDASFIKMDIEGCELAALKGAEEIILRNKPKLAVCIYHKAEDYYKIPLYLKTLVPEYKFYVRHHFYGYSETVLYAVFPAQDCSKGGNRKI